MKIKRCPKCGENGGHLTFRRTKPTVLRKYPYVGHYDFGKKSKRRWCSLNENQVSSIEIIDDWYQTEYTQLIKEGRRSNYNDEEKYYRIFQRAEKLLNKHGFPQDRCGYKVYIDGYL